MHEPVHLARIVASVVVEKTLGVKVQAAIGRHRTTARLERHIAPPDYPDTPCIDGVAKQLHDQCDLALAQETGA